jgi:hypothetical protein
MEAWNAPTTDTRRTACYAALGFPVRVEAQIDESTGRSATMFFLGQHAAAGFPPASMSALVAALDSGDLEATDPTHPLLSGLRAMHNFSAMLNWLKTGNAQRLHGIANNAAAVYQPADQAHAAPRIVITTRDIDVCAALAVVGVPVVSITGYAGAHNEFTLSATGLLPEKVDAALLLKEWRAGNLKDFSGPFVDAMNALKARRDIMDFVRTQKRTVLIRKPGSRKRAVIMETAGGRVLDEVRKHFLIP